MSQELVKHEYDSGFTPEGYKPFPNTYVDLQLMTELGTMVMGREFEMEYLYTDEVIDNKIKEYEKFLTRKDIMPRAINNAKRILTHLSFEKMWRAGLFEEAPDTIEEIK